MSEGKRYSAGAIFLQVVPVFSNVQKAIRDNAQDMDRALGDQMEKSGEKAGERAGKAASKSMSTELKRGTDDYAGHFETSVKNMVKTAERELGRIDLSSASSGMLKDLDLAKKKLKELSKTDFNLEFDAKKVLADVKSVEVAVERVIGGKHEINIDANLRRVAQQAAQVQKIYDKATEDRTIKVDVDTTLAERKMGAYERTFKNHIEKAMKSLEGSSSKALQKIHADLQNLNDAEIGIDISAGRARFELGEIMAELEALDGRSADIDVKFESGAALAQLKAFDTAVDRIDGRKATVRIDVNQGVSGLSLFKRTGDDAANSFRSFNAVILAAAALGPALVPVLGALAGGLLAIGPAAAIAVAGLAAVIIGFTGIGDALKALQQRDDAAAMTAQTAGRAQVNSAKRVADARRAAAKAIESALERQKAAQERYAESIQDVKDAEQALREARAAAKGTGKDIADRIKDNQLSRDQGVLDVFNATVKYDSVMADGSATNAEREQARIDLEQARRRLEELRKEQKQLAKEKRKWDREGVNGTKEVQSAQDRLNDAIESQRKAYQDLGKAAKAVDEARADGARNVADAMKSQGDAMDALTAQQNAVNNAFDDLGPAGRKFTLFLYSLRGDFKKFRSDVQTVLLPAIQEAMEGFMGSGNADVARRALIGLAAGFGAVAVALSTSLQGEAWSGFFTMLADLGPRIQAAYGAAFISFLEAMASIMTTLAPYALLFANGLASLMDAFALWAGSEAGANGIQGFMEYAKQVGPEVLQVLGLLATTLANLLVAMAPYGKLVLDIIVALLEGLNALATGPMSELIPAFFALITASQIAYLAMNALMAGAALFTSTLGATVFALVAVGYAIYALWKSGSDLNRALAVLIGTVAAAVVGIMIYVKTMAVIRGVMMGWAAISYGAAGATYAVTAAQRAGAIAAVAFAKAQMVVNAVLAMNPIALVVIAIIALVAAIVILWRTNAKFRDFVKKAWAQIKDGFAVAWEYIKVGLKEFGKLMLWLWHNAVAPALNWIKDAFPVAFRYVKLAWDTILWPVLRTMGKFMLNLYKLYFKVALIAIKVLFKATFVSMKWLWQKVLKPTFNAIGKIVTWLWRKIMKPYLGLMKAYWTTVFKAMKWVWDNVLRPVFNAIADKALPKLKNAFKRTVDAIGEIWGGLKKIIGTPIKFVINEVLRDGLIGGFNKVAKWVGQDGYEFKGVDWKFASGGVLPGYTPGRDVHDFYSPSAGRLRLSGGEAIMRPEWTAAMGTGFVDQMNGIARRGGVGAVRQAMMGGQAFAGGGIFWPLPGGRAGTYANHDGVDLNVGSGWDDNGLPFYSATSGKVTSTGYGRGYGNAVFIMSPFGELVYGHSQNASIAVSPGQKVSAGQYLARVGNTGNSSAPHLHFGFPGGTFAQAMGLLSGAAPTIPAGEIKKAASGGFPKWIINVAKNPLGYVKGLIDGPIDKFKSKFEGPVFKNIAKIPGKLVGGVKDAIWDMLPGTVKSIAKGAGKVVDKVGDGLSNIGKGLDSVVPGDGIPGLATGGVIGRDTPGLPYNGTMMYDNGGYLPPGLTTVMNLTGKPEPVFTSDQWANVRKGGTGQGGFHYEPHFDGSNLTAEDVAADLNFTYRRMRRAGKYAGVGSE